MDAGMKVSKWGNSLAVRIPKDVVETLGLEEGDRIAFRPLGKGVIGLEREPDADEVIESIRRMARPLPEGWKFDREEANAR